MWKEQDTIALMDGHTSPRTAAMDFTEVWGERCYENGNTTTTTL